MKKQFFNLISVLSFLVCSPLLAAESVTPAPDFKAMSSAGKEVSLSQYKGKNVVVLEWLNHGCPFVKKHYGSKNMQKLQEKYTGKGVIWLSVISSAPGKQGHSTAEQAEKEKKSLGAKASAILLDETGKIGKLYGAKTTPHMFVIDKQGNIAYQGAIDDKPGTEQSEIAGAKNYVTEALDLVLKGESVKVSQQEPYGCSVKYN